MKRREFLFSLAGAAVFGFWGKPLAQLSTAVSSPPALAQNSAHSLPNFGSAYQIVGSQESAQGTYLLLNHQGWPIWLHKASTDTIWRTATPPWHIRRMAKLLWRFS